MLDAVKGECSAERTRIFPTAMNERRSLSSAHGPSCAIQCRDEHDQRNEAAGIYYEEYKSHGPSGQHRPAALRLARSTTAGPSEAEGEQRIAHGSDANDARSPPSLVAMHWRTRGS